MTGTLDSVGCASAHRVRRNGVLKHTLQNSKTISPGRNDPLHGPTGSSTASSFGRCLITSEATTPILKLSGAAAIANPPDNPIHHQVLRDEKGLRPGGFGLLLSRSLVDELIHSEKGNEVILVKYLNAVRPDSSKS